MYISFYNQVSKYINYIHMDLYMEVVSSLWIFMFKDLSNDILKMKFESSFLFPFEFLKNSSIKIHKRLS
jgi:hypothetical protein